MASPMVRETVGAFHAAPDLQKAADELLIAGFDRSYLSLMATCRTVEQKLGHLYDTVAEIEDDPDVPRVAFVGCDSRTEAKGAAVAVLAYIGAIAASGAIVASGGTVALASAAALAAGGAGGALGAALAYRLDRRHARNLEAQLARGGILLWVRTLDAAREDKACAILARNGAADVHVHDVAVAEPQPGGGVSQEMTWIGKPILQNLLGVTPRAG